MAQVARAKVRSPKSPLPTSDNRYYVNLEECSEYQG